MLEDFLRI